MKLAGALSLSVVFAAAWGQSALAVDVSVKGVHLCCGGCVSAATAAVETVKGLTNVGGDANTKVIAFKAPDMAAAKAGLEALAKAGFHGTATADKRPIPFPAIAIKKGTTAPSVTITGLHLCCGACKQGLQKALATVDAIQEIKIDQDALTCTVTGTELDVNVVFDALYKGGYHGELQPEKPQPEKPQPKKP